MRQKSRRRHRNVFAARGAIPVCGILCRSLRDLILAIKFQRQQSRSFLGEAAPFQICHPQKFPRQLYVHCFHNPKSPHQRQFVMSYRLLALKNAALHVNPRASTLAVNRTRRGAALPAKGLALSFAL